MEINLNSKDYSKKQECIKQREALETQIIDGLLKIIDNQKIASDLEDGELKCVLRINDRENNVVLFDDADNNETNTYVEKILETTVNTKLGFFECVKKYLLRIPKKEISLEERRRQLNEENNGIKKQKLKRKIHMALWFVCLVFPIIFVVLSRLLEMAEIDIEAITSLMWLVVTMALVCFIRKWRKERKILENAEKKDFFTDKVLSNDRLCLRVIKKGALHYVLQRKTPVAKEWIDALRIPGFFDALIIEDSSNRVWLKTSLGSGSMESRDAYINSLSYTYWLFYGPMLKK